MEKDLDAIVSEVSTNFKRGTTEMLLLSLLTLKDWYVYDLSKTLKKASNEKFDIQGPSLYTALYRMQDHGFVSSHRVLIGQRTRIYYHLLPKGEEYLKKILKEYFEVGSGIHSVLQYTELNEKNAQNDEEP